MTARDCDRACGCRAEVERLRDALYAAENRATASVVNRYADEVKRLRRARMEYPNFCKRGHRPVLYAGTGCPACGCKADREGEL